MQLFIKKISEHLSIILILMVGLCISACHTITRIDDPANTYNAATTYQKLITNYPFIKIASTVPSQSVKEIKNITYVSYGNRALQLDLYLPVNPVKKLRPGIIFVHGGGWMSGYRENFTPMSIRMAEHGYVAATISYRLSPEAKYPAAIQDAKAAVSWLRAHAKQYGVDAQHIAIAGGSAGGQIASLAGVTDGERQFDPLVSNDKISTRVQAIINIDGLSDFTSETARKYEDDPKKNPSSAGAWFGGRYADVTSLWNEASPINHVNNKTPPILFIGSAQTRFSVGREEMIEKMKLLGIPAQVILLPDTPHSFWMFDPWLEPTVATTVEFLNQQFHYVYQQ